MKSISVDLFLILCLHVEALSCLAIGFTDALYRDLALPKAKQLTAPLQVLLTRFDLAFHEETIHPIQKQMNENADGDEARFLWNEHEGVHQCCPMRVQGMEANAASIRIVNRCCQEMIEIDQHGRNHHERSPFPPFAHGDPGEN